MSVYLLATLDTKGREADFLRDRLRACGADGDVGRSSAPWASPFCAADISREELFRAGGATLRESSPTAIAAGRSRWPRRGAAHLVREHHAAGRVSGVLAIGGSAGTTIGTAAMRALPLGVPKLMVSTLASGQVRHYVGDKDIMMLNAVVDLAGLNRISRAILDEAARAMAGMVCLPRRAEPPATTSRWWRPRCSASRRLASNGPGTCSKRPATRCSCFTPPAAAARRWSRSSPKAFAGVLDITTTELADELVGGCSRPGPTG